MNNIIVVLYYLYHVFVCIKSCVDVLSFALSPQANHIALAFHRVISKLPVLYGPPSRGASRVNSRRNSEVSSSGVTEDASVDTTDSPKEKEGAPKDNEHHDENCNVPSELKSTIIKLESKPKTKKDTEKWVQSIKVHITDTDDPGLNGIPNGSNKLSLDNDEGFAQEESAVPSEN